MSIIFVIPANYYHVYIHRISFPDKRNFHGLDWTVRKLPGKLVSKIIKPYNPAAQQEKSSIYH